MMREGSNGTRKPVNWSINASVNPTICSPLLLNLDAVVINKHQNREAKCVSTLFEMPGNQLISNSSLIRTITEQK